MHRVIEQDDPDYDLPTPNRTKLAISTAMNAIAVESGAR